MTIGNPDEPHCSLFHAVERIIAVAAQMPEQWDERFAGHTAEEIFAWIDAVLYSGDISANCPVSKFDFFDEYR